ncbi:Hypothetical protein D9617_26g078990 [Elsinoe fawcettii]|nr:Hypothetical protein D9617_26g078990 [Elsinoe fawcettii]
MRLHLLTISALIGLYLSLQIDAEVEDAHIVRRAPPQDPKVDRWMDKVYGPYQTLDRSDGTPEGAGQPSPPPQSRGGGYIIPPPGRAPEHRPKESSSRDKESSSRPKESSRRPKGSSSRAKESSGRPTEPVVDSQRRQRRPSRLRTLLRLDTLLRPGMLLKLGNLLTPGTRLRLHTLPSSLLFPVVCGVHKTSSMAIRTKMRTQVFTCGIHHWCPKQLLARALLQDRAILPEVRPKDNTPQADESRRERVRIPLQPDSIEVPASTISKRPPRRRRSI